MNPAPDTTRWRTKDDGMNDLTARQLQVLCQFRELEREKGYPPTVREMAAALGVCMKAMHDSLMYIRMKKALATIPPRDGHTSSSRFPRITAEGQDILEGIGCVVKKGIVQDIWRQRRFST
jgi:hypothetical protein